MPCIHLRELYDLCEKHELRISSHDAIRIMCRQCEEQEVCPSSLTDGENVLRMPNREASEGNDPSNQESGKQESGNQESVDPAASQKPARENRPR